MFVFKTIQISFCPLVVVLAVISFCGAPASMVSIPIWFVGYMTAGVWLNRFRCPRCGKLYYWRIQLKGAVERQKRWRDCHWCALPQDALPS